MARRNSNQETALELVEQANVPVLEVEALEQEVQLMAADVEAGLSALPRWESEDKEAPWWNSRRSHQRSQTQENEGARC